LRHDRAATQRQRLAVHQGSYFSFC
jgi:hypothetical protein